MTRVTCGGVKWHMFAQHKRHGRNRARSRAGCFIRCAVAVVLACSTDDAASPASGEPNAGDALGGAGGTLSAGGSLCPAPTPAGNAGSAPTAVWSRSPENGDCCRYASLPAAPSSWPYFETEAECQSSCRCAALEGLSDNPGVSDRYDTERSSLECRCSSETCPSSLAEAERLICSRSSSRFVERREGCGRVMIAFANGATGEAWIFERPLAPVDAGGAGERLIGASQFSDVPYGPCQTYEWIAGSSFDCDDVTTCQPCAADAASSPLAACE